MTTAVAAARRGLAQIHLERPPWVRVVICASYALSSTGLLILGLTPNVLFDKWALVGAAIATLLLLVAILTTGLGQLYLGIGGAWIYATVMELIRVTGTEEATGLGLIFLALAVGALAAYTAWRREAPLRA